MRIISLVLIAIVSGCATQSKTVQSPPLSQQNPQAETGQAKSTNQTNQVQQLLNEGYQTLAKRNTKKAVEQYFDKAIALCNEQYKSSGKTVYAARSSMESLHYLMKAASENQAAIVVDSTCAEALFLKGYASLDLGRVKTAMQYINQAIKMSPVNSKFLSELGHIYQLERNYDKAFEYYKKAEDSANSFSPPQLKVRELGRAKRGIAYVYIELGKLDAAEALYRECLKLDSNDKMALHELKYIESIRNAKK